MLGSVLYVVGFGSVFWGRVALGGKVPTGDADPLMPLAAAQAAVSRRPDAKLSLRPGDSHLGGFTKVDEV